MDADEWQRLKPCLELYPIQIIRVRTVAPGRFRVDGSGRSYEGRILPEPSAVIRQSMGDHLANQSFRTTQRFLLNRYHDRWVSLPNGQVFYLTDAWHAPHLQMTKEDVTLGVSNLVALHEAMDGFIDGRDSTAMADATKGRYGTWEKTLEQGAQWIATERVLGQSRREGLESKPWAEWLSRWEEQAQRAVLALQEAGYKDISKDAENRGEWSWNDYRLENLIQRASGKVVTNQLQDPIRDCALYDLATLCQEICAAGDAEGVNEAISQYSVRRPLTPEHKQLVRSFAAYPHHALVTLRRVRMDKTGSFTNEDWRTTAERHWSASEVLLSNRK